MFFKFSNSVKEICVPYDEMPIAGLLVVDLQQAEREAEIARQAEVARQEEARLQQELAAQAKVRDVLGETT